MSNPNYLAACYAIIENQQGDVLFQKRANTGFRDGEYQVPAGHIESEELLKECLIREMKEELDIDIIEKDLEIQHISHRVNKGGRLYFDVYIKVKKYTGIPKIAEEHKCSELKFIDIYNIEEPELFSYDLDIIKQIKEGKSFSEFLM